MIFSKGEKSTFDSSHASFPWFMLWADPQASATLGLLSTYSYTCSIPSHINGYDSGLMFNSQEPWRAGKPIACLSLEAAPQTWAYTGV